MSSWTAPATWAAAVVTTTAMNTEVRDHAVFLKGALDLLTNSTTADTGTSTYLSVTRAAAGSVVLQGLVTGDAVARFNVDADGGMSWGAGAGAHDAFLARTAASALATSDTALSAVRAGSTSLALQATVTGDAVGRCNIFASGEVQWSNGTDAADAIIGRASANVLRATSTALSASRSVSTYIALQALVSGDSVGRLNILASGLAQWSSGSSTADVTLGRTAAGVLAQTTNGVATASVLRVTGETGQTAWADVIIAGDSASRVRLRGDNTVTGIEAGPGSGAVDVNLKRNAADTWKTDDGIWAAGGLVTLTKAGTPTDSDLVAGMQQSGAIVIDTTNSYIYVRVGSTWKRTAALV